MLDQKDVNVATVSIRRVIRIGGSLALTLPPEWARKGRLAAGDEVALIANGELRIVLIHDKPGKAGEVTAEGDA
jgi:antitoxin component of MazEF toxin-antitoxin module